MIDPYFSPSSFGEHCSAQKQNRPIGLFRPRLQHDALDPTQNGFASSRFLNEISSVQTFSVNVEVTLDNDCSQDGLKKNAIRPPLLLHPFIFYVAVAKPQREDQPWTM